MTKPNRKPVAPVAPAAPAIPNFSLGRELLLVREAAASVSGARETLARRIAYIASHGASDGVLADMQREVIIGYIAGRIAGGESRDVTDADYVTASLVHKMTGAGGKAPNKFGQRSAEQETWYGAARNLWHESKLRVGIAPDAKRSKAAKDSAAKRAPRAGTKAMKGATKVAKGVKTDAAPATAPATAFASKSEAIAGAMQYASAIKTLAEQNSAKLGKALVKTLTEAADRILTLPM